MSEELVKGGEALDAALYAGKAASLRDELAKATDIVDEALIERMLALGIRPETLAALTLIPLVAVAWADDDMDPRERTKILEAAEKTGMPETSPSYRLLRIWTYDRPAPALLDLWRDFVGGLGGHLSADEQAKLGDRIIGRARDVAAAAGDLSDARPGISEVERALLDDLEGLFRA
ncbi:MAG: hypothetical protein QNK05_23745 [Myxococcota bacterium]|nr:hypothetical protein [Myxococcota bacterium]